MLPLFAMPLLHLGADTLAVAAGIAPCVEELMEIFVEKGGESMQIVRGPSGALARQMDAGAPYDLLMVSETRWPGWLVKRGGITDVAVFSIGQLTLWNKSDTPPDLSIVGKELIAIPDPETTAYGMVARDYLKSIGIWEELSRSRVAVFTSSSPQAVLAALHGSAKAAFVPLSAAVKAGGSFTIIPGAVIEHMGGLSYNPGKTAGEFWSFCRSPEADSVWLKWGIKPVEQE